MTKISPGQIWFTTKIYRIVLRVERSYKNGSFNGWLMRAIYAEHDGPLKTGEQIVFGNDEFLSAVVEYKLLA